MKKTDSIAVIVGSNGQDGQLLDERLQSLGYEVIGLKKGSIDITNPEEVTKFTTDVQPQEIYFLAAHHHSSEDEQLDDGELFRKSINIHTTAAVNFLDSIANHSPITRFFYASSCLVFSPAENEMQTEDTALRPESAYAITKVFGMMTCWHYRKKGVFASIGILYNHESPLRSRRFVSRKIAAAAARIAQDGSGSLGLGDLEAKVDWGYAHDYVEAIHLILQTDQPKDYVIASGQAHTVREFADIAFKHVGLDYRNHLSVESQTIYRTNLTRIGDSTRLREETGWKPTISFEELVRRMVDAEIKVRSDEEGYNKIHCCPVKN